MLFTTVSSPSHVRLLMSGQNGLVNEVATENSRSVTLPTFSSFHTCEGADDGRFRAVLERFS